MSQQIARYLDQNLEAATRRSQLQIGSDAFPEGAWMEAARPKKRKRRKKETTTTAHQIGGGNNNNNNNNNNDDDDDVGGESEDEGEGEGEGDERKDPSPGDPTIPLESHNQHPSTEEVVRGWAIDSGMLNFFDTTASSEDEDPRSYRRVEPNKSGGVGGSGPGLVSTEGRPPLARRPSLGPTGGSTSVPTSTAPRAIWKVDSVPGSRVNSVQHSPAKSSESVLSHITWSAVIAAAAPPEKIKKKTIAPSHTSQPSSPRLPAARTTTSITSVPATDVESRPTWVVHSRNTSSVKDDYSAGGGGGAVTSIAGTRDTALSQSPRTSPSRSPVRSSAHTSPSQHSEFCSPMGKVLDTSMADDDFDLRRSAHAWAEEREGEREGEWDREGERTRRSNSRAARAIIPDRHNNHDEGDHDPDASREASIRMLQANPLFVGSPDKGREAASWLADVDNDVEGSLETTIDRSRLPLPGELSNLVVEVLGEHESSPMGSLLRDVVVEQLSMLRERFEEDEAREVEAIERAAVAQAEARRRHFQEGFEREVAHFMEHRVPVVAETLQRVVGSGGSPARVLGQREGWVGGEDSSFVVRRG